MSTDDLVPTRVISDKFDISERTLGQWRYRGEGPPYYKLGNHVRYSVAEVEGWLAGRRVAPRSS